MTTRLCDCPRCRRRRELSHKLEHAHRILEAGAGRLTLQLYPLHTEPDPTPVTWEMPGDRPVIEAAVGLIEEEIESVDLAIAQDGHRYPRARTRRSRWMQRGPRFQM